MSLLRSLGRGNGKPGKQVSNRSGYVESAQTWDPVNVVGEPAVEGHEDVSRRGEDRMPDVVSIRSLRLTKILIPRLADELGVDLRQRDPDTEPQRSAVEEASQAPLVTRRGATE